MNPNDRDVTIRLPRKMVCRLLVLLSAMRNSDDPEPIRRVWREIHIKVQQDLTDHDLRWRDKNAI